MDNLSKKLNITIGISAHNEEKNIANLLGDLSKQVNESFLLDSITVICDGCTDRTEAVVENCVRQDKVIKLINDRKRLGKISRLNWLCKNTKTDILIILDADIRIKDTKFIQKIVHGFDSTGVGLVAGLQMPDYPRTFMEKIFIAWEMIWIEIRRKINNGISVHNISGCNFAMSKSFYTELNIPKEVIAEDEFLFFAVRKAGLRFTFIPEAQVFYHLPATFKDYLEQSVRFITTKHKISNYFGESIEEDYRVPFLNKLEALLTHFMHKPLLTIFAVITQIPIRIYAKFNTNTYGNHVYEQAMSTK